jgi:hypothetical protein
MMLSHQEACMQQMKPLVLTVLLVLAACAQVPPPPPTGPGPVVQGSGQLPPEADPHVAANRPAFARFAGSRFWGNGRFDDERTAQGGGFTTLLIEALVDGHMYVPTTAPALVARMMNRGGRPDAVYRLDPNPNRVYYVVARRDAIYADTVRYTIYSAHLKTGAVDSVSSGYVRRCHRGEPGAPPAASGRASFGRFEPVCTAPGSATHQTGGGKSIMFEAAGPGGALNLDSGWFACDSNGCCTFDSSPSAY